MGVQRRHVHQLVASHLLAVQRRAEVTCAIVHHHAVFVADQVLVFLLHALERPDVPEPHDLGPRDPLSLPRCHAGH